jgi:hypothetical protein
MKKYFYIIVFAFTSFIIKSNAQERISGSLKYGSLPNSVMIALKSNTTFTGNFSNIQFMLQVPNTVSPQPTATILNNPLSVALNNATFQIQVKNENGFYNYTFNASSVGAPPFTFNANVEYNALEIKFTDGPANLFSDVRLGHLPDGGSNEKLSFYIEMGGNEYTNYTNMFYGTGSSNGGSFSSYSFVPLSNILLPVQFTGFTVAKSKNDALLKWQVENQTPNTAQFQIERSLDGMQFVSIGQLPAKTNTTKAAYQFTDIDAGLLKEDGLVHYRIKQTDLDGKFTYSSVQSMRIVRNPLQLGAFPNPVKDITRLKFESTGNRMVRINVYDANGKNVLTLSHAARIGQNQLNLNAAQMAKGTYQIVLTDGDQSGTVSITKQ